ncbi:hypothetical protein ACVW01_002348 [Thermostichus sp. MS-CIW-19]
MVSERPPWQQRHRPERRLSRCSGRPTRLARDLLTGWS